MYNILKAITLVSLIFSAHVAFAETYVGYQQITEDTTWTKENGPYVVNGWVSIAPGATLIISPGVVVKFMSASSFGVAGTLRAEGTVLEPVIFTSITDDVGGDTNTDAAATSPQAGDWGQVYTGGNGAVVATHAVFRFGGRAWDHGFVDVGVLGNNGGMITVTDSLFSTSSYQHFSQQGGTTTIIRADFTPAPIAIGIRGGALSIRDSIFDTTTTAIEVSTGALHISSNHFGSARHALWFGGDVRFSSDGNNTGTGDAFFTLSQWHGDTIFHNEFPYVISGYATIPTGASLYLAPGAVMKFDRNSYLNVGGILTASSSSFTSLTDDSVWGDTNHDGAATIPHAGDYCGIFFGPGGRGIMDHARITYGGCAYSYSIYSYEYANLENNGGVLEFSNLLLSESGNYGLRQYSGQTTIVDSEITKHQTGIAVYGGDAMIHHSNIHNNISYGVANSSTANVVDATNNWWGSTGGPQFPHKVHAEPDAVSPNVIFSPWLNAEPSTTTPSDVCVTDCFSNVLFLPGMMGSRLFEESAACGLSNNEKERWASMSDCDHAHLSLSADGKSLYPLYTKEGVSGAVDDAYSFNVYQSFMDDLDAWKNDDKIIEDYAIVPYDWRLSLEDVLQNGATSTDGKLSYGTSQGFFSAYIYNKLAELVHSSRTGKVTIIAHSNGGLLTKALIQKLKENNDPLYDKIDNIIFVAVPQVGTPEAVVELLHGKELGPLGFVMSAERLRNLTQNMPSAYHLLPSSAYFPGSGAAVATPVITIQEGTSTQSFVNTYGREIANEGSLRDFLLGAEGRSAPLYDDTKSPSVLNLNLLTAAKSIHQQLDDDWEFSASTTIYQIAGWGEDTVSTINYKTIPYCERTESVVIWGRRSYYCAQMGSRMTFEPKEVIDGDGTVVVPSALAMSTSSPRVERRWVDLMEYDTISNLERSHADILEIPELRATLQDIISGTTTSLDYISSVTPPYSGGKPRLRFLLHSPLYLSATDNIGNTVSSTTSDIQGGRWKQYGDVQVLTVPKNIPMTLHLDGYADGSFTLDIQEVDIDGQIITSSTLAGIPSATSTKAAMNFTDGTLPGASSLFVDYDGDSINDFTLVPKIGEKVVFDTTPPEARISFSTSTKKLLIEGIDAGGETTVFISATSSLVTDQAGNTLEIIFKKFRQEGGEIKLEIQELRYNGVSSGVIPKTTLQYEWSVDKSGNIKELEEKIISSVLEIKGHYNAKKDITTMKTKLENGESGHDSDYKKEILSELVLAGIRTDKGNIAVSY